MALHCLKSSTDCPVHIKKRLSSVQFSRKVMSDSLRPHGLQHTMPPCQSPTPRACSNSSTKLVMPSNHLILCCPLLLLPPIPPSIRVFSNESVLRIRWPKYWSFGISPFSEYSGLTSFRIDWFAFLAVQGTLRSLLQHHILHLVLDSVLNGCSTIQGVSVSSSAHFDASYLSRKLFIS